jgi:hypothetical protein
MTQLPACLALHRNTENAVNVWSKKQKIQEDDKRKIRRFQDKNMTNLTKISRTADITCLRDTCVMHASHRSTNCCKKENKSCILKQLVLKKTAQIITKQILFNLLHMPWSIKLSPACTLQSLRMQWVQISENRLPRLHASWMLFNLKPTTVIRQSYLCHIFKRDPL